MKATFLLPLHGNLFPGGAEQQATQTALELTKLGVEVEYLTPLSTQVGDIVHAFGSYAEFRHVQNKCRAEGVPFVVSTIFYRPDSFSAQLGYKLSCSINRHENRFRKKLLQKSDFLLPNTQPELLQVTRLHSVSPEKCAVIPNGAEARFADATPDLFRQTTGIEGRFVLNVGRIEGRKNQVRLAEAARKCGYPLVIIGKVTAPEMYQQLQAMGKEQVRHFDALDHNDPLLASAYAACEVFALPSRLETPGIAALEASLTGAKVVITPVGGTREYFLDHAFYPDVYQVDSIASALQTAWEKPRDAALKERVLAEYSWAAVARKTLAVYQKLLDTKKSGS